MLCLWKNRTPKVQLPNKNKNILNIIPTSLIIQTWIPREQNRLADYYGRMSDTNDCSIDQNSFETIFKKFVTVTFDRFANNLIKKVSVFNSKYY